MVEQVLLRLSGRFPVPQLFSPELGCQFSLAVSFRLFFHVLTSF